MTMRYLIGIATKTTFRNIKQKSSLVKARATKKAMKEQNPSSKVVILHVSKSTR